MGSGVFKKLFFKTVMPGELKKSKKWSEKEVSRVLTKILFIQMCFVTSI